MTRREAIKKYIIPALNRTWNENKCKEILEALEQEPCGDCVSRDAVIDIIHTTCSVPSIKTQVKALPPVTSARKCGMWIKSEGYDKRDDFYTCSECGRTINVICGETLADYPYCHCGSKMVELRERKDKE